MNNSVPQSKGCSIVNMPFRLITAIDILEAMRTDQLEISRDDYQYLLEVCDKFSITIPYVMDSLKPSVEVSLHKIKKTVAKNKIAARSIISDFENLDDYRFQEGFLMSIKKISSYDTIYDYLMSLSETTRKALEIKDITSNRMCGDLCIKKSLKRELLCFTTAKKTKKIGSVVELKEILIAVTIFDFNNQDLLEVFRTSNERSVLFENACAELLFRRLGIVVRSILPIDTKIIVKRLISKISKMPLTGQQQIAIKSIITDIPNNEKAIVSALNETKKMIAELEILQTTKEQLIDYVKNLINIVIKASVIYNDLFLNDRGLWKIRLIYISNKVLLDSDCYRKQILDTYCSCDTLTLYPTKDYGDLLKHLTSNDCSNTMCEEHLKTTEFFNIRIFIKGKWRGNIYMLDFTEEHGILILDRIEISKRTQYVNLFKKIKEAMQRLFEGVRYKAILAPPVVSNNSSIQDAFNKYSARLEKIEFSVSSDKTRFFESLKNNKFFVFCNNSNLDAGNIFCG